MNYSYECGRITAGQPLFCNFCGRSYDVKLCPRLHVNPRIADVCSQCGSRELSTPQPKVSLAWQAFAFFVKVALGGFLAYVSVAVLVELLTELLTEPRVQNALIALGLLLVGPWFLWGMLPDWFRKSITPCTPRKTRREVMGGVEGRHQCESNEVAKTMTLSPVLYSSRSEDWETPQDLFDELHREFAFTLDACATSANAKCKRFFDKRRDGLKQDWTGERVFMNPPYGKEIGRWMNKARTEAEKDVPVVCLEHARTDTRWWHENVEGAADEVRFIRGRLRFGRSGVPSLPAPFPSAIVVYRHQVGGIR